MLWDLRCGRHFTHRPNNSLCYEALSNCTSSGKQCKIAPQLVAPKAYCAMMVRSFDLPQRAPACLFGLVELFVSLPALSPHSLLALDAPVYGDTCTC